jgi:hypothetical protein
MRRPVTVKVVLFLPKGRIDRPLGIALGVFTIVIGVLPSLLWPLQ